MCDLITKLRAAIVNRERFALPNNLPQSGLLGLGPSAWKDDRFEIAGGQFQYEGIPYSYVAYYQGKISIAPFNCEYAMSFNFSGCLMASFKIRGQEYVCHITSDHICNRKKDFYDFLIRERIIANDFTIFKPQFETKKDSKIGYVCGLISKERGREKKCYSIGCSIYKTVLEVKESTPLTMNQKLRLLSNSFDLEHYSFHEKEDTGCCRI